MALGTGCLCGFPNSETDRFCGGCGVSTVQGRASSPDLRITTIALRPIAEPPEQESAPPERRSIDEMTVLRRPASKTEENEREPDPEANELIATEPPERRSIDEMTVLRRPAPKTEENERALQFHEDTSTQRIEMLCDAVATDPNV